jgi:hypothetical protein
MDWLVNILTQFKKILNKLLFAARFLMLQCYKSRELPRWEIRAGFKPKMIN